MQLIYIHGLDSGKNSIKGQWLEAYCAENHPHIIVQRPDLNMPPLQVFAHLSKLIAQDEQTALVGSSLGGFFTTACVAEFNLPAVLINPSVRPFDSLQRFVNKDNVSNQKTDTIIYSTEGGWNITHQHFADLKTLYKDVPENADKMLVLLKTGDEVLDYRIAKEFYSQTGAASQIIIDEDGDHAMHDIQDKFPMMIQFLFGV